MYVIEPIEITDVNFTSSTVAEADYTEFTMSATFAEDDYCQVTTVSESLWLDVAPATAWAAGDLITGTTSGQTAYVVEKTSTTTYKIRDRSGAFTLDEIIGVTGTPAKLADQGAVFPQIVVLYPANKYHKVYQSLIAGNTLKFPPGDVLLASPSWLEIGATNPWLMFDAVVGTQTENATSIVVVLGPGAIDSVTLLNTEAASVNVTVTVSAVETFNETQSGTESTGSTVLNVWEYLYGADVAKTDFYFEGIPPDETCIVTITITNTLAKCGSCIVGQSTFIGKTLWGVIREVRSSTRRTKDVFGNYTLTSGNSAKKMQAKLSMSNAQAIETERIATKYLSANALWIAGVDYSNTYIHGFCWKFRIDISQPKRDIFDIEIIGTT